MAGTNRRRHGRRSIYDPTLVQVGLPELEARILGLARPELVREPIWSAYVTRPMARWIPSAWRAEALFAIKGIHTVIFFSVFSAVVVTLWDGLRGAPGRRTAIAGALVLAETALYVSNNQVCPLTPLAEDLGGERGSVVDMFLPELVARQIPRVAGTAAVFSLALNLRALARRGGW